jgi:hypothetical protein
VSSAEERKIRREDMLVGVAKSAIRNPQSAIQIDNPQSQSTIEQSKDRQSSVRNPQSRGVITTPSRTLYKSEHIRARGDVSLDSLGPPGGGTSGAHGFIAVRAPCERFVSTGARDAARSRCGAGCRPRYVRAPHRASLSARTAHQSPWMALHRDRARVSRSAAANPSLVALD